MCVLPTPQGKAYTYLSVLKTGTSSDLLAERHLVELVQHRLVEPFAKAVGLRRFGFCLGVVDIVDRQVAEDLQERRVDFSVDVPIVSQAGTAVRTPAIECFRPRRYGGQCHYQRACHRS